MSSPRLALLRYVSDLRNRVQDLLEAGETWLLSSETAPAPGAPVPSKPRTAARAEVAPGSLDALAREVAECRHCPLGETRTQAVFGEGDPGAGLVFVGEAPGADEDRQGRPFVGQAGKLLTKIIESIGFSRDGVYICNVLKCRPPGNRNPLPAEIAACRVHLEQQLSRLRPKLICTLGAFAAQTLLETQEPLGSLRGRSWDYRGIPVVPTLHPAALLYHPQNKRLVWEDMKRLKVLYQKPA